MWRNAEWAKRKGLFAELHPDTESMDESLHRLSSQLSRSSAQAMKELKTILWKGTEHWDELLYQRAAISGTLVLSEYTRKAIANFKAKA